jgi:hypothetical protein
MTIYVAVSAHLEGYYGIYWDRSKKWGFACLKMENIPSNGQCNRYLDETV